MCDCSDRTIWENRIRERLNNPKPNQYFKSVDQAKIHYDDSPNFSGIIAVIIGTSIFKNIIQIDIETENEHRKKSVALTLIQHFIKECINNGYVIQWDCMDTNIDSKRLAEKAGFKFFKKGVIYWFEI